MTPFHLSPMQIQRPHTPGVRRSRRQGFSLAELMVVIVIIGLLATLVVPSVIDKLFTSQRAIAKADIITINEAITTYMLENLGAYPETLQELVTPDENGKRYLDLDIVPKDPWGNEYGYQPPSGGQKHVITCYGSDGAPGGEGDAMDFTNIMIKNKEI